MKKSLFFFAAIVTVSLAASCQKELVSENNAPAVQQEISLRAVTGVQTKSALDGTAFPQAFDMLVSAYYNAPSGGTSGNYFTNTKYTYDNTNHNWKVADGKKIFWPLDGTLDFLAIASNGISIGSYSANCIPISSVSWGASNARSLSVALNIVNNTTVAFDDVLYGRANTQSKATAVTIPFEHAYSAIVFKAKCDEQAWDSTNNYGITIKSIVVKQVNASGTFAVANAAGSGAVTASWTNLGTKSDINARKWNASNTANAAEVVVNTTNLIEVGSSFSTGSFGDCYVLVPPQAGTSFIVTYTIHNGKDGENNNDKDMTYTYTCPQSPATNWERGKKYIYALDFQLDEIKISPSVTDWTVQDVAVNLPPQQ